MADQPKSRLDREIDEILEKKSREPIEFSSHPRVKHQKQSPRPNAILERAESIWQALVRMPIVMAYVLGILSYLVRDSSPLLALLFAAATAAALWIPGLLQFRSPTATSQPEVKYWRGKAYTQNVKSAVSRHPIDSLKRYFDRKR